MTSRFIQLISAKLSPHKINSSSSVVSSLTTCWALTGHWQVAGRSLKLSLTDPSRLKHQQQRFTTASQLTKVSVSWKMKLQRSCRHSVQMIISELLLHQVQGLTCLPLAKTSFMSASSNYASWIKIGLISLLNQTSSMPAWYTSPQIKLWEFVHLTTLSCSSCLILCYCDTDL